MPSNLISQVRNLQRRKARRRSRTTVAEGLRLCEEALDAGVTVRGVLADAALGEQPRGRALLQCLADRAVRIEELNGRDFRRIADTDTPQGVIALVELPPWRLDDVHPREHQAVLVLDGVQDPGNVGALIRTAFALGSPGVLLLGGTADVTNPKVLRGTMGAAFRLPVVRLRDGELRRWVQQLDMTRWAAVGYGVPLRRLTPPERLALVVGNEGAGVRPSVRALASHRVTVPLAGGAESLNVAVAAGIILHEVGRGR